MCQNLIYYVKRNFFVFIFYIIFSAKNVITTTTTIKNRRVYIYKYFIILWWLFDHWEQHTTVTRLKRKKSWIPNKFCLKIIYFWCCCCWRVSFPPIFRYRQHVHECRALTTTTTTTAFNNFISMGWFRKINDFFLQLH